MPPHLLVALLLAFGVTAPGGPALAASSRDAMASPLPADALPVPPPKPAKLPGQPVFAPAPVPDPDLQRPLADVDADRPRTKVVPNLFKQSERRTGDGFVNGSAGTYDSDHRLRPSPEINLRVPLQ